MAYEARHGKRPWVRLAVIAAVLVSVGAAGWTMWPSDASDGVQVATPTSKMRAPSAAQDATGASPSTVGGAGAGTAGVAGDEEQKALSAVMAGDTVLRAGDDGLPVKFVQQRLVSAGLLAAETGTYDDATTAAVDRLQEKFELTRTGRVNRYTLDTLLRITARGPTLPSECLSGVVVCVDKTARLVRLVENGSVVMALDARFGRFGALTREGAFQVYDKKADDFSQLFEVPMQYSLYFSGGQAIHYSPFFARDGYTGNSAGCVNTRDLEGARAMYERVPLGATVYVYQ